MLVVGLHPIIPTNPNKTIFGTKVLQLLRVIVTIVCGAGVVHILIKHLNKKRAKKDAIMVKKIRVGNSFVGSRNCVHNSFLCPFGLLKVI